MQQAFRYFYVILSLGLLVLCLEEVGILFCYAETNLVHHDDNLKGADPFTCFAFGSRREIKSSLVELNGETVGPVRQLWAFIDCVDIFDFHVSEKLTLLFHLLVLFLGYNITHLLRIHIHLDWNQILEEEWPHLVLVFAGLYVKLSSTENDTKVTKMARLPFQQILVCDILEQVAFNKTVSVCKCCRFEADEIFLDLLLGYSSPQVWILSSDLACLAFIWLVLSVEWCYIGIKVFLCISLEPVSIIFVSLVELALSILFKREHVHFSRIYVKILHLNDKFKASNPMSTILSTCAGHNLLWVVFDLYFEAILEF